jgi:hypothetical protein
MERPAFRESRIGGNTYCNEDKHNSEAKRPTEKPPLMRGFIKRFSLMIRCDKSQPGRRDLSYRITAVANRGALR